MPLRRYILLHLQKGHFMGLLTNSKLLTETENIAPKNKTERIQPQKSEKQEKQPQREGNIPSRGTARARS